MTGREIVCVNGRFLPIAEATIPAFDSGFLYGDGVFETFLVHRGRAPFLERHYRRLRGAAAALCLELPETLASADLFARLVARLAEENAPHARPWAGCRVSVSRGPRPLGPLAPPVGAPTLVASLFPAPSPEAEPVALRAAVSEDVVFSAAPWTRHKTLSSVARVLGRLEAARRGFDDVVFADAAGRIAEATSQNVFALLGDDLWATPPLCVGILPGITRETLLRAFGAGAVERHLTAGDLASARCVCLTGSLRGVVPLVALGEARLDPGPAAVPRRLVARAILEADSAATP